MKGNKQIDFTASDRIDSMALRGYNYAINERAAAPRDLVDEMDIMAFNAGISNANIRHGLGVAPYVPLQSGMTRHHETLAPRSDLSMQLGYG